jgi:tyrosinase
MGTQTTAPATPRRATLGHRRSVAKLTKAQLAKLREAFAKTMALTDERGFSYFAGWHGEPFSWCEHHTDLFLPWHRAYLYYFELALQAQAPGVRLPWWDWTTAAQIPKAYLDEQDAGGEDNPLLIRTVTVYRSGQAQQAPPRDPGGTPQVPAPPYAGAYAQALQAPTFRSFSQALEAIHDNVHVWVGGIMQDIQWAAYDPLFFAHHTMVDRAWRIWQHRHPGALPPSSIIDTPLRPNGMTVRQTLDVTKLGYEYAGTASHAPGTA